MLTLDKIFTNNEHEKNSTIYLNNREVSVDWSQGEIESLIDNPDMDVKSELVKKVAEALDNNEINDIIRKMFGYSGNDIGTFNDDAIQRMDVRQMFNFFRALKNERSRWSLLFISYYLLEKIYIMMREKGFKCLGAFIINRASCIYSLIYHDIHEGFKSVFQEIVNISIDDEITPLLILDTHIKYAKQAIISHGYLELKLYAFIRYSNLIELDNNIHDDNILTLHREGKTQYCIRQKNILDNFIKFFLETNIKVMGIIINQFMGGFQKHLFTVLQTIFLYERASDEIKNKVAYRLLNIFVHSLDEVQFVRSSDKVQQDDSTFPKIRYEIIFPLLCTKEIFKYFSKNINILYNVIYDNELVTTPSLRPKVQIESLSLMGNMFVFSAYHDNGHIAGEFAKIFLKDETEDGNKIQLTLSVHGFKKQGTLDFSRPITVTFEDTDSNMLINFTNTKKIHKAILDRQVVPFPTSQPDHREYGKLDDFLLAAVKKDNKNELHKIKYIVLRIENIIHRLLNSKLEIDNRWHPLSCLFDSICSFKHELIKKQRTGYLELEVNTSMYNTTTITSDNYRDFKDTFFAILIRELPNIVNEEYRQYLELLKKAITKPDPESPLKFKSVITLDKFNEIKRKTPELTSSNSLTSSRPASDLYMPSNASSSLPTAKIT